MTGGSCNHDARTNSSHKSSNNEGRSKEGMRDVAAKTIGALAIDTVPSQSSTSTAPTNLTVSTDTSDSVLNNARTVASPIAGPSSRPELWSDSRRRSDPESTTTKSGVVARLRKTFKAVQRGSFVGVFVPRRSASEQEPTAASPHGLGGVPPNPTPRLNRFLSVGSGARKGAVNLKRWASSRGTRPEGRFTGKGNNAGASNGNAKCEGKQQTHERGRSSQLSNSIEPRHDDRLRRVESIASVLSRDGQASVNKDAPSSAGTGLFDSSSTLSTGTRVTSSPIPTVTAETSTYTQLGSAATMNGGEDVKLPQMLVHGTPMLKVSQKKTKPVVMRIDPDGGYILWPSKKSGISAYSSYSCVFLMIEVFL